MAGASRFRWLAIATVALLVLAAAAFAGLRRSEGRTPEPPKPEVPAAAAPTSLEDPIAPGRPLAIVGRPGIGPGIRGAGTDTAWVTAPPSESLRREKPPSERGGVDPCDAPDPGFAGYSRWKPLGAGSLYLLPEQSAFDDAGRFDLVLHFHGHDVARKGFVRARPPVVLVGTSLGTGGAYRTRISGPDALAHLIAAIEAALEKERGAPAKARRIAVTAWSAGYEAVGALLEADSDRIDAVALLDGLHGSRDPDKLKLQLAPFTRYAQRAARGEKSMFVTHSSIEPGTYASTTETAHFLVHQVGGRPLRVRREDPLGLELVEAFSLGNLHVRGYAGGGEADHCAHFALMEDATRAIARRWKL